MDLGVIKYHIQELSKIFDQAQEQWCNDELIIRFVLQLQQLSDNSRFNEITPIIPWISDQTEEIIDIATHGITNATVLSGRLQKFSQVVLKLSKKDRNVAIEEFLEDAGWFKDNFTTIKDLLTQTTS